MGEIGVFLSLGLSPKSVVKIQNRQLDMTFLIGGAAGLALAVPFSFGIWSLLSFIYFLYGWSLSCGMGRTADRRRVMDIGMDYPAY